MGNLIWHEYSRLVSISSSVCELPSTSNIILHFLFYDFVDAIWAAFFGLFYRKFFWDFVGGTLRDPGGIQ